MGIESFRPMRFDWFGMLLVIVISAWLGASIATSARTVTIAQFVLATGFTVAAQYFRHKRATLDAYSKGYEDAVNKVLAEHAKRAAQRMENAC